MTETTDLTFRDWPRANGDDLTAAFGSVAEGWLTEALDVRALDILTVELNYGGHASGNRNLQLQLCSSDQGAADLDAYYPDVEDNGTGTLTDVSSTLVVPSGGIIRMVRFDVRAKAEIVLRALISDATGNPTPSLTVREIGWGRPLPRGAV